MFGHSSNFDLIVREFETRDLSSVYHCDLHCFSNYWTAEEWRDKASKLTTLGTDLSIYVALHKGKLIGFSTLRRHEKVVEVEKVAVLRPYRREGVGSRLVLPAMKIARTKRMARVFMVIPEYRVYPGENSLSEWLISMEFTPQTPFIEDYDTIDGESCNGVRWDFKVQ